MTLRDREGLITRIRQIRRVVPPDDPQATGTAADREGVARPLEARVAHLERLLEGLQDSVHRESERQAKMIADLQAQIQPAAIRASLAKDARERGL